MIINYHVGKRHFPIIQPIFTRIFLCRGLTKRSKVAIDPKVNAREIGKSKRSSNKLTRVASNLGAIGESKGPKTAKNPPQDATPFFLPFLT